MDKKSVYCEMAFLKPFLDSCPTTKPLPNNQSFKNYQCWTNILSFICRSNVTIDCKESEFLSLASQDETYAYLWQQTGDGYFDLEFNTESFPYLESTPINNFSNKQLTGVFLTGKDLSQKAEDIGVININTANFLLVSHLFKDNGIAIGKDDEYNWSFLRTKARHNCNTLIFVDNYGMKEPDINLYRILDCLLPQKCKSQFQLLLVSLLPDIKGKDYDECVIIQKSKYKRLRQWLHENRPQLCCQVETYISQQGDFHDRFILSNNIWIKCPGGFDLFKKTDDKIISTKSTEIMIVYPYFQSFSEAIKSSYIIALEDLDFFLDEQKTKNKLMLAFKEYVETLK